MGDAVEIVGLAEESKKSVITGIEMFRKLLDLSLIHISAAVAANREFVKTLLVPVIVPFNLIKAGVNSVVTFLAVSYTHLDVYKRQGWPCPSPAWGPRKTPCWRPAAPRGSR